eukprot:2051464-Amphidinium_carterae.2
MAHAQALEGWVNEVTGTEDLEVVEEALCGGYATNDGDRHCRYLVGKIDLLSGPPRPLGIRK